MSRKFIFKAVLRIRILKNLRFSWKISEKKVNIENFLFDKKSVNLKEMFKDLDLSPKLMNLSRVLNLPKTGFNWAAGLNF